MKTKIIMPLIGIAMAIFGCGASANMFTMGSAYGSPMNITFTLGTNAMQSFYGAGGNFGGIGQANLDGLSLAYVYCIDLFDDIGLNTSYSASFTTNGTVAETTAHPLGNADSNGLINNAAAIAWLIDSQASLATNRSLQSGLQLAIWIQLYGPMGGTGPNSWNVVNMSTTVQAAMNTNLSYLALASDFINTHSTALISSVYWIDPSNGILQYQQLVAANPINVNLLPINQLYVSALRVLAIPEPEYLTLIGIGVIGFVIMRLKKK
jgi:hypothetical protein